MSAAERILVVEDEGVIALHIQRRLERMGYTCVGVAADAERAVELSTALKPDLVLMDIILQGPQDGIAAATEIRRGLDLPVVFLTAHSDPGTLERARTALAYGYLVKPFEERELKVAIETALYRHQAERTQRLYRRAIEASRSAVLVVDASADDQPIIEVNAAFETITGYSAAEVMGRNCRILQGPDTDPAAIARIREAISRGQECTATLLNYRKDGTTFWNHLVISPVRDSAGCITHFVGVQSDVTADYLRQAQVRAQEEYLRTIVQHLPECLKLLDREGLVLDMNPAGLAMLEAPSRDAVVGRSVYSRIDPEYLSAFASMVEGVFRGESRDLVFRAATLRGNGRWFETRSVPLMGAGSVTALLGVTRDITERIAAEREARVKNQALDCSLNAVAFAGLDGTLTWVNQAFLDLWRYPSRDEVVGRLADEFWVASDAARKAISRMEAVGSFREPLEGRRRDGTTFIAEVAANMVRDAESAPICLMATFVDVTERERAGHELRMLNSQLEQRIAEGVASERQVSRALEQSRNELLALNHELQQASRHKDEFLAGMSHELRTPLTSILGLTEALKDGLCGPLNQDQVGGLEAIEESGQHLLALINDILDLAKIEAGQTELEIGPCSARSIGGTVVQMIAGMAIKKSIAVTFESPEPDFGFAADARLITQMLVNLLGNAVKFTPPGGRTGLRITADPGARNLAFSVWDTGIGIDEIDVPKLFRAFVQLDSRLARQYGGTGLGLALVQRIAELHGGGIAVASARGEGSRFTVTLPWTSVDAGAVSVAAADTGESIRFSPAAADAPLVLIADDNQTNLQLMADYIERAGFRVATARDGLEVLDTARRLVPDLILMDIQMPGVDGLEATRALRLDPDAAVRAIPVLAVTALTMPGDRERCMDAGANEYLSKPLPLKDLVAAVHRWTGERAS